MIDNQHADRDLCRRKFEPELFLEHRKNGWTPNQTLTPRRCSGHSQNSKPV
jgi:hypothetical protein